MCDVDEVAGDDDSLRDRFMCLDECNDDFLMVPSPVQIRRKKNTLVNNDSKDMKLQNKPK